MPQPDRPTRTRLRSRDWFDGTGFNAFAHRSWMKNQGIPDRMFDGRPVIGICNTWSELTPCNAHFRELADHVRYGVLEAGGFPVEFPVTSLGETVIRPTTMLLRNLVSMDVEESIRGNPLDGVVLLAGCDKTTPALLMGAASCDLPTIVVSGGPMLGGRYRGKLLGSGTSVFQMSEEVRAGSMTECEFRAAESAMSRTPGHCNTMGTASTMAAMVETLGLSLPGNAATPAVDSRRRVLARDSGVRAVAMVHDDVRISDVVSRSSFLNAIRVNAAIGGSTNAVLHLLALAGRLEIDLELDDFARAAADVPLLVDLMPSGRFLMENFFDAGGVPAVIAELGELLDRDAATVTGEPLGTTYADADVWDRDVIRSLADPLTPEGGVTVLRGNLAPDGAVIKTSAATSALLKHVGPAKVFDGMDDFNARLDSELDVDADTVLVVRGVGPKGYPGMPEVGNLPLPRRLLADGVTDMVRISDARMSGTAFGTVVLHVAPEAAAGGTLSLVRDGDPIELDTAEASLRLLVPDDELAKRHHTTEASGERGSGGYTQMYVDHVMQADRGVDLDFLVGRRGTEVHGDNH